MYVLEVGKLYRWTEEDSSWSLHDVDGKWTNRLLSHKDVFLVLSSNINILQFHCEVKLIDSNGNIGTIRVNEHYIKRFKKLQ